MQDTITIEPVLENQEEMFPVEVRGKDPAWMSLSDTQLASAVVTVRSKIEEWKSQLQPHIERLAQMEANLLERMRAANAKVLPHDEFLIERTVSNPRDIHAAGLLEALTRYNMTRIQAGEAPIEQEDIDAAVRWVKPDPILKADGTKINSLASKYGKDVSDLVETHCPRNNPTDKLSISPKSKKMKRVKA